MAVLNLAASVQFIRSGKLKALAYANPKRSALFPDVPTLAEAGVSGAESASWYSLAAPADTPVATIAAPTFPTPKAGTTVTLPAGWLTHLSAGTANAIGFTDPTGWHVIKPVPTLQITYS